MGQRKRILVLDSQGHLAGWWRGSLPEAEVVAVGSIGQALAMLRIDKFDAFTLDPGAPEVRQGFLDLMRSGRLLDALDTGVAIVDADLRVVWANPAFERCCSGPVKGQAFYEALGSPEILGPDYSPFHTALAGHPTSTRLHCNPTNRFLQLSITPMNGLGGDKPSQVVTLARDVTAEVYRQQMLETLHRAGEELAPLDAEQMSDMSVQERIELLKENIRRLTRDLLRYDVIEIRLLDRKTGRLEPLLQEGMTAEAAARVLSKSKEGNGVTGFVAETGQSYLCRDTRTDPLYIEGAAGARSSMTVPLLYEDQVIGTFNVESPEPGRFKDEDLQFVEIFCREIASALHTLELLSAEKNITVTQSIDAIHREVALPVDDIIAAATAVLDRYIGHDAEITARLRQILAGARAIRQTIDKVGEGLVPGRPAAQAEAQTRPLLRGKKILVADNDERVRRSAHDLLGRWGCTVETARDGREALAMARQGSYDAILTDIRLPDLTGYEAYRQLREAQPQARVVLMTSYGYDPSHTLVKARQDGLRFVLFKPFRVDQLLTALESPDTPAAAPAPAAPASGSPPPAPG